MLDIRLGKVGKGENGVNPGENNNKNKAFRKMKKHNRKFKIHIKALKRSNHDNDYDSGDGGGKSVDAGDSLGGNNPNKKRKNNK